MATQTSADKYIKQVAQQIGTTAETIAGTCTRFDTNKARESANFTNALRVLVEIKKLAQQISTLTDKINPPSGKTLYGWDH